MDRTDFLSKVSIFSHMKSEDLKRIAEQAQYQEFNEGEVISFSASLRVAAHFTHGGPLDG